MTETSKLAKSAWVEGEIEMGDTRDPIDRVDPRTTAIEAAPPRFTDALHAAEKEAVRLRVEAERAAEAAAEAARVAEKVADEAEAARYRQMEAAATSSAQIATLRQTAMEAAREALRPQAVEREIQITSTWDWDNRGTKAIEFTVPGAPNFARHKGADPHLRAYVNVNDLDAPMPMLPRERSLDRFFETNMVVPRKLDDERIIAACEKVLREHLDMVDRERIAKGEPGMDEAIKNRRLKVRA